MKFKRLLSLLLCIVLLASCVLPLASCKKDNGDNGDSGTSTPGGSVVGGNGGTTPGKTNYTVQVKTAGGMPLEGIMVYVHKGDADFDLASLPQETNAEGIATFELDTADHYSIQLDGVPKGYNVKSGDTKADRYPMDKTGAVITVSSAPISTGGFSSSYELGDVMYDFTLTDVNGNSYKLSDLLKTKQMVMINFWYRDCSNCAYEFPYINAVYQDYTDKLEILAVNDYPSDTADTVKSYSDFLGEDLKMPLIKVGNTDEDLTLSKFDSQGYPTTIIIDRYGVIAMVEVGAVLGENKWKSIFDHFTAKDYEQKLIDDASVLTPKIEPTVQWTDSSADDIANAFNSGSINVTYRPEESAADAKYAWPFIPAEYNGEACVKPSNYHIDNSFSILYADIELKPGEAIVFDYYSSTQKGYDVLYVLVDGKDIYSVSGDSADEGWSTCCTYVDPRPVLDSNKNDVRTYELAFAYYKDDYDNYGDDTVYLKDLRVISVDDIEIETYIFRYAATEINDTGSGYDTYAEVYLGSDGYYHVGSPDDENGENDPFLLANLLSYTNFDPYKTVSQRVYENYELMVDGVNKFDTWLIYGNAASNSQIYSYTSVTEELATLLKAYCQTYYREVGKSNHENLWLQLCAYYDAYGKDENGNPAAQLENPIKGLTDFSAFEIEIKEDAQYESGSVIATGEVTYDRVIMPRGYLYKFVPAVSGVYRIISDSDQEVDSWIFVGDSTEWSENGGDRTVLTHHDVGERFSEDLLIDKDGDGIKSDIDYTNTTLVAYMEAGKSYYIDIAYYDVYATGTFNFSIKWVGDSFGHFIQASAGPITYVEGYDGSMGMLIASGITPIFAYAADCSVCGELVGFTDDSDTSNVPCAYCGTKLDVANTQIKSDKYAFQLKDYDENGKPVLGMAIYADLSQPTTLFQTQSIQALIIANAFNFTITESDREALIALDGIKIDGKAILLDEWKNSDVADPEKQWNDLELDEVIRYVWTHATVNESTYTVTVDFSGSAYTTEQQTIANKVISAGIEALKTEWDKDFADNWSSYQMTDIINNCLKTGTFHNTDNRTDKDKKAQEYWTYFDENGKAGLMEYWDAEFSSITPPANGDGDTRSLSERRYDYFWDYYQMDDVKAGIFHGKVVNYTETVEKYVEMMENDAANNIERVGCVAVTEELADILTTLIDKEVFEDVYNGWLKFCYYYNILGA